MPRVDTWSIVAAGQPWTSQDWLSNVILALGENAGAWGETALSFGFGAITVAGLLDPVARERAAGAGHRLDQPGRVAEHWPGAGGPGDGRPGPGPGPAAGHRRPLGLVALPDRPATALAGRPAGHRARCGPTSTPAGSSSSCLAARSSWARRWTGCWGDGWTDPHRSPGCSSGTWRWRSLLSCRRAGPQPERRGPLRLSVLHVRHHRAEPLHHGVVPRQPRQPVRVAPARLRGGGGASRARPRSATAADRGCVDPHRPGGHGLACHPLPAHRRAHRRGGGRRRPRTPDLGIAARPACLARPPAPGPAAHRRDWGGRTRSSLPSWW